jgi:aspartate--ammonia ligase
MLKMPAKYKSILSPRETEHAIVAIKDFFQLALSTELNLYRVTAPLFVESGTGINDDLNGVERPVSFPVKDLNEKRMEIVLVSDDAEYVLTLTKRPYED